MLLKNNWYCMCLQVLNVSGNNLDSIRELECLRELTQIMANDNNLNDMRELGHLLTAWRSLWRLELIGNPMCHKSKYRDRVIVMAHRLEILDGKEISDNARQFLENWQASKEKRRDILSRKNTEDTLNLGHLKDKDLPPVAFPKHGGIPGYIMP
ncbi:protein phosphatase 1 regulatory subunit 42-like, partial [Lingula anatina]|uniref:Protein phosphatase 1 regulatory subunit 42-like n=1 Tax=Lingula anatina TaxID=7574 RepID=A0A1S3JH71_LINAN